MGVWVFVFPDLHNVMLFRDNSPFREGECFSHCLSLMSFINNLCFLMFFQCHMILLEHDTSEERK